MKRRVRTIYRRMVIQEVFLLFVATAGYGLFFLFQNPRTDRMGTGGLESEICQFLIYVAAVAVTLGFWGGFIESVFLPVSEYVGRDWRLPDTVADHEFQFRRQISWGMESVFLHLQRVGRRRGFSLDIWENGLYLYWNPGSGGIAWNHETARQVIPAEREIILRIR